MRKHLEPDWVSDPHSEAGSEEKRFQACTAPLSFQRWHFVPDY